MDSIRSNEELVSKELDDLYEINSTIEDAEKETKINVPENQNNNKDLIPKTLTKLQSEVFLTGLAFFITFWIPFGFWISDQIPYDNQIEHTCYVQNITLVTIPSLKVDDIKITSIWNVEVIDLKREASITTNFSSLEERKEAIDFYRIDTTHPCFKISDNFDIDWKRTIKNPSALKILTIIMGGLGALCFIIFFILLLINKFCIN